MACELLAVCFEALRPQRVAQFWAGVLGREVVEDAGGVLLPGNDTQVGLRFVPSRTGKVGPNRVHLHLTSTSLADQQRTVEAALELGARHIDVGQRPEEGHVVLADLEGNGFCVIEPGNKFLDGCGFLGEIACHGTREVGLFWSAALDWPLVWDRNQETAIQSLHGGTKVAWGGQPPATERLRNRQRFDLVPPPHGDLLSEVDRLVSLGATRLETGDASYRSRARRRHRGGGGELHRIRAAWRSAYARTSGEFGLRQRSTPGPTVHRPSCRSGARVRGVFRMHEGPGMGGYPNR